MSARRRSESVSGEEDDVRKEEKLKLIDVVKKRYGQIMLKDVWIDYIKRGMDR